MKTAINRRQFVRSSGVAALALAAPLSGCGERTLERGSVEALQASAVAMAEEVEATGRGKGRIFLRAVYRLSAPPAPFVTADDFDPLRILMVATDRGDEPEFPSPQYLEAVMRGGGKIDGLGARAIVGLYVASDLRLLNEQREWARGFENRVRRRIASLRFDEKRRKSVVERVAPRKAGYRWTLGARRAPVIDFEIFNPIDKAVTGVDFDVDLIGAGGRMVASGLLGFVPVVALQPGVFGAYTVEVGDLPGFGDIALRDLREGLQVAMRPREIYVDDHRPVLSGAATETGGEDARNLQVRRLLTAIADARASLLRYRIAFS